MYSLYIDTHCEKLVLCIFHNEKILKKSIVGETLNHSAICMPTLVRLMNEVNLRPNDLNDIVVVNGPGSFTGERLGVTIAKTLAYTLNIPIRVISSLEITLASISLKDDTYIVVKEKNGYFLALFTPDKKLINDYFYLSNSMYDEFKKSHQVCLDDSYDLEKIIVFAHQKEALNPHLVNPFYVKKIEVEK